MNEKKTMEHRSYEFDVEAKGNVLTGRAIVYNERTNVGGMFEEVIEPGALDHTDLKDVRFLVNHDMHKIPLARSRNNNGNSTLKLTVDEQGLSFEATLDVENNADARALYSAVERGDISGMSFGFFVDDEEWEGLDRELPLRKIRSILSVIEISSVSFPQYTEGTHIDARDAKQTLESAKLALDSARESRSEALDSAATENTLQLLHSQTKTLLLRRF